MTECFKFKYAFLYPQSKMVCNSVCNMSKFSYKPKKKLICVQFLVLFSTDLAMYVHLSINLLVCPTVCCSNMFMYLILPLCMLKEGEGASGRTVSRVSNLTNQFGIKNRKKSLINKEFMISKPFQ